VELFVLVGLLLLFLTLLLLLLVVRSLYIPLLLCPEG
jgi:hypothetical protein